MPGGGCSGCWKFYPASPYIMNINNIGGVGNSSTWSGYVWVAPSATTDYTGSYRISYNSGWGTVYSCPATLYVNPPANCSLPWGGSVASGSGVTAYQSSTVPYGSTCSSQYRSCSNGSLSGSYQYQSCTVQPAVDCTGTPWGTVANGNSVTAYQSDTVPYGSSCTSESRTCNNGTLSGSYAYTACTVDTPADCTLDGSTVAHGDSITAYSSPWLPNGSSCASVSESRMCTDGTLSGSDQYAYASCVVSQPASCEFSGYAWSGNTGWLSLSCADSGTCGTANYGLQASDDGTIFGYGWSSSIGWVSANPSDLVGCPIAPCAASLDGSNLTGWLKALSGGTSQSGGWDGWISLSGTGPDYGVSLLDGGSLTGYGWGTAPVGWVDFEHAQTSCTPCQESWSCNGETIVHTSPQCIVANLATCNPPDSFCAEGISSCIYPPPQFISSGGNSGHLQIRPQLTRRGGITHIYWDLEDVDSCTVTGTNGNSWTLNSSGPDGQDSSPIYDTVVYTLNCTGLDSSIITETATAGVVPVFQEK